MPDEIQPRTRSAAVYRQNGSVVKRSEAEGLEGEDVVPGFRQPLSMLFH